MPDLSYLNVKPEARDAFDALNRQLDYERGNCYNQPEVWTAEALGNIDSQVTARVAERLCGDCPALKLCHAFAELEQPEGPIIQGGVFYPETTLEEDNAVQDH